MILADILSNPMSGIFFIIAIVAAVSVHEFAHAKSADVLGDPTPASMGRVTLNPRAHLDPVGSILFLLVGFGWGKPVQYDPYNLENPKRDAALIALAGPGSNIAMALASSAVLFLYTLLEPSSFTLIGQQFFTIFIWINVVLAVFNVLPFAPLDGFKIVGGLLPHEYAVQWEGLQRYGIFFLIFFIFPFAGGKSMLELFLLPLVQSITGILIP